MLWEALAPVLAQAGNVAEIVGEPGLTPAQGLSTALTVEGLLFAAFGVSYNLATTTKDGGRSIFVVKAWFGWLIFIVICAVAASAWSAWCQTFPSRLRDSAGEQVRAYGLLAGIIMQPIFAAIINLQARR